MKTGFLLNAASSWIQDIPRRGKFLTLSHDKREIETVRFHTMELMTVI